MSTSQALSIAALATTGQQFGDPYGRRHRGEGID
jgi:hypothetical protein